MAEYYHVDKLSQHKVSVQSDKIQYVSNTVLSPINLLSTIAGVPQPKFRPTPLSVIDSVLVSLVLNFLLKLYVAMEKTKFYAPF